MADIPGAGLTGDHRFDRDIHRVGQIMRDIADAAMFAAGDVVDPAYRARMLEREHESIDDIAHIDEVTALMPVLENDGRRAIAKP